MCNKTVAKHKIVKGGWRLFLTKFGGSVLVRTGFDSIWRSPSLFYRVRPASGERESTPFVHARVGARYVALRRCFFDVSVPMSERRDSQRLGETTVILRQSLRDARQRNAPSALGRIEGRTGAHRHRCACVRILHSRMLDNTYVHLFCSAHKKIK